MTGTGPDGGIAMVTTRLRAAGCVFAEDEARLLVQAAPTASELDAMVDRRAAGLPLEHVLGWAEFCGLRITVHPGVFVPRRRSALLVRQASAIARAAVARAAVAQQGATPLVVVDLCCGSGAVGVAVATAQPAADLHAADIDPAAVACARENVGSVGGSVYQGDLYDPLPARLRGHVDLLLANAPYVPAGEIPLMPPEARIYEPRAALDGGADGVSLHRRIAAQAPGWLAPDGHLLIETSDRQASLTAAAMTRAGLVASVVSDDELDATVVIGSLPAQSR